MWQSRACTRGWHATWLLVRGRLGLRLGEFRLRHLHQRFAIRRLERIVGSRGDAESAPAPRGWAGRLGAQTRGDSLKENTTATASLWYYPRLRGGPFVEGGVGLSDYRVQKVKRVFLGNAFADSTYVAGTGGGVTFGVGWEVPQGEFRVAYAYGYVGALHAPGGTTVAKRWKQNLLLVQVEFRSGR